MHSVLVLLHGLGAHPATLWPLATFLRASTRYDDVRCLTYDVTVPLAESVASADASLRADLSPESCELTLLGHSWGGLVANRLHSRGWAVAAAIYISSPLHGASVLNWLQARLPEWAWNCVRRIPYETLMAKAREEEPPHPYRTISCGYLWSDFDACVWREEATLDPARHTHISCHDHRLVVASPMLWRAVRTALSDMAGP